MKRRILSLLLVICMVATLLPVMAGAEEAKSAAINLAKKYGQNSVGDDVSFPETLRVTEGGEAVYAITQEDGLSTKSGADAGNYNVKLEYPAGGIPTIYLKNANIVNNHGYGITPEYSKGIFPMKIVVESDSKVTASMGCIYTKGGDLTITGPGKLTMETTELHSVLAVLKTNDVDKYDLYLKDANLDVTCSGLSGALISTELGSIYMENTTIKGLNKNSSAITTNKGDIIATNCTIQYESSWSGFQATEGSITLTNCTVNAISGFKVIYADKDVLIKNCDAYLEGDHFENSAIDVWGTLTFDNSTVEMYALDMPIFTEGSIPTFVGYYRAIAGADKDNTSKYKEDFYNNYQYMKIVPADTPEESTEETYEDEPEESTEASTEGTNQTPSNETTNGSANTPSTNPGNNTEADNSTILWIVAAVVLLGVFAVAAILIIKKSKAAE